ncbi:MAG: hypothetical protein GX663_09445 [Clostridiales bacterium]|nr:hypothetical protein [Clostridiales bacterium]
MKEKGSESREQRSKAKVLVYIILRVLVVMVLIAQIFNHNWHNVMTCGLTLILFMMPSILSREMKINLPTALEVIILLFIFAAEILGEIHGFYVMFPRWDDMLHTMNGFLAAAIGFAMIDILNRHERVSFNLSPAFVALVAFCFSMTIGVLWEFFECSMDMFFGKDMQKDTWLAAFNSVAINPDGLNVPVSIDVTNVTVNNMTWDKYLDIGLYDTMHDLFVNFIGAMVFSILGLIYIKNRGKGIASKFIPTSTKNKRESEQ